ncbi:MAG: Ig-like domain repeat protein, partial [Terracidiphilus sp.]
TVASLAPSALALDSAGNLYTGSNGGVLKLIRTQGYVLYAGTSTPPQTFKMLESGNLALSPTSLGQTDTTDYSVTATTSTDCTVSEGLPVALAIGGVCSLTASYTPTIITTTTDTVTVNGALNAALSTPASVQLVLTGPSTAPTSSIKITSFLPAAPTFGQSVTASATVTGSLLEPAGTVAFYLDGSSIAAASGTVNGSGVATGSLTGLSIGLHSVTATYTSSNGYPTSTTPVPAQLQVSRAASSVSLVSSLNPILLQNPVTYTATVSSTAGNPTGTVTFSDGGTVISACASAVVTVSNGQANCAVTYTVTGTHSITAVYSGDTNFLAAGPSNTVSEAAIDINLVTPSTSETLLPGGTATYLFPIAPSNGTTFPSPVTFTVSSSPALPSGTTMTLTPPAWVFTSNNPWSWTLPANTSLTSNTMLTIQLPQTTASAQPAGGNLVSRMAPFSLALLLLPFAGRLRKSGKRLARILAVVLLAGAGAATLAGLSGCGTNTGFFAQTQQNYKVTVTVGSGSLSYTSTVNLTVE